MNVYLLIKTDKRSNYKFNLIIIIMRIQQVRLANAVRDRHMYTHILIYGYPYPKQIIFNIHFRSILRGKTIELGFETVVLKYNSQFFFLLLQIINF